MSRPWAPGFIAGARCLSRGLRLIVTPGLRAWALLPACTSVLLYGLAVALGGQALLSAGLGPAIGDELAWLLWLGLAMAGLFVFGSVLALLAGLLAAPFLGYLTTAVEQRLSGAVLPPPGAASFWWRDFGKSLAGEWRKLRYILLVLCLPALLLPVPGANLLAPACWFAAGAWLLAVEFTDYPFACRGQGFPAALECLRRHRRLAFGFGASIALLSAIPIVNCLVLPAAVAGASLLYRELVPTDEA